MSGTFVISGSNILALALCAHVLGPYDWASLAIIGVLHLLLAVLCGIAGWAWRKAGAP